MRMKDVEEFWIAGLHARTNNAAEATERGQIGPLWKNHFEASAGTGDEPVFAVYTDYAGDETGDYTFVLGRRVPENVIVRDGLKTVHVLPGRYAVFTAEDGPAWSVVPELWKRIWKMSEEELGGRRAFRTDYEIHSKNGIEIYIGLV